jgi:hypothetical protein
MQGAKTTPKHKINGGLKVVSFRFDPALEVPRPPVSWSVKNLGCQADTCILLS